MLNRAIQVKMIKTDKKDALPTPAEPDINLEGKVAIIGHYLERLVGKAGQAVIAYVVVDTIRKILVAKASR